MAQGVIGQAQSQGDTFRACVTGCPIQFSADSSGSPSNCRIVNPTLIDCNHTSGNIALVIVNGTNNRVEGIQVFSPGGVLYTDIVWFPAAAVNCFASIDKAPSGITSARFSNQSATCFIVDRDDMDAQFWQGGGTPVIASAATIAPTLGRTFVSGSTQINTITVPIGCQAGGSLQLIPGGGATWTLGTTGNIALGVTAAVSKVLTLTYDPTISKWFPSYTT